MTAVAPSPARTSLTSDSAFLYLLGGTTDDVNAIDNGYYAVY